jgi:hypothetical protein
MQKIAEAHETLMSLSFVLLVVLTCLDDHFSPLNVATVLGFPATPLAPTAAQNALPTQEIE